MKRLFAVIHVIGKDQAVRNAALAARSGCDGVFLISHGSMEPIELLRCVKPCRESIPYVGVNLLGMSPLSAASSALLYDVGAVWTDATYPDPAPSMIEVFSGFAFKYQPQPRDLATEAVEAARNCHVLTTSGPGTGKPADVDKIKAIRAAIGDHRLALASGIQADNVEDFLPYVDDFLVATGISKAFTELDEDKTRELAEIIHDYT